MSHATYRPKASHATTARLRPRMTPITTIVVTASDASTTTTVDDVAAKSLSHGPPNSLGLRRGRGRCSRQGGGARRAVRSDKDRAHAETEDGDRGHAQGPSHARRRHPART